MTFLITRREVLFASFATALQSKVPLSILDSFITNHPDAGPVGTGSSSVRRVISGDYELNAEITGPRAVVAFSGRQDYPIDVALEISNGSFELVRREKGNRFVLKKQEGNGAAPWKVRLLKKGNYFRYWVNDVDGWIREPLGMFETDHPTNRAEPMDGYLAVETTPEGKITSCNVTLLPWLQTAGKPVISAGPDGTFKEGFQKFLAHSKLEILARETLRGKVPTYHHFY